LINVCLTLAFNLWFDYFARDMFCGVVTIYLVLICLKFNRHQKSDFLL